MTIFFYGLFMDEKLLTAKGIRPSQSVVGLVNGYRLRIGKRATLERCSNRRVYGVLMDVGASEIEELYAEPSVADYVPESVVVELLDGMRVEATCYNLPAAKISGTNHEYAKALLLVATNLGFPDSYLGQIRRAAE